MRCLGLDPSLTAFGWSVHDSNATGLLRCVARGRFKTSAKTLYISRYQDLRERLRTLIREQKPDYMGIEFPVFDNLFSEGLYGLFLYCSEAIKEEKQDVVFWSPLQIKAHARDSLDRPKGWKMMKSDMVEAAKEDTGFKGTWNHNEADAYLCARLSARFWLTHAGVLKEADLTPTEQKYFFLIKKYVRGKKAGKEEKKGLIYREDERFFQWSEDQDGTSTEDPSSSDECDEDEGSTPENGKVGTDPCSSEEGTQD